MTDNKRFIDNYEHEVDGLIEFMRTTLDRFTAIKKDIIKRKDIRGWHRGEMAILSRYYEKKLTAGIADWEARKARLGEERDYNKRVLSLMKRCAVPEHVLSSKDVMVLENVSVSPDGTMAYTYFGKEYSLEPEYFMPFYSKMGTDGYYAHTSARGKVTIFLPRGAAMSNHIVNPNIITNKTQR